MDDKIKEDFLANWPQNKRATIMNQFLGAIRDGETEIGEIRLWLRNDAERRLDSAYADAETRSAQNLLKALTLGESIVPMIEYCLWWESLTSEQKHKFRQAKGTDYAKQVMATKPPTEKQIKYLRALGCDDTPLSSAQASEWIDARVKR